MKKLLHAAAVLLLLLAGHARFATARAQGTMFTYQGRLNDGANPAGGSYDLRFALFDAVTNGAPQGVLVTNAATVVTNGLFAVTLDFGNQFSGAARWLEIAVRTNGAGSFTTIAPRQPLTPTPYAVTAGSVASGGLAAGTYGNAVTLNNAANNLSGAFAGNGANMTNVNAAALNGLNAGGFWQLGGNPVSGGQFLGSTNNQPVEVRAGGQRGLWLEACTNDSAHAGIMNILNGSPANYAASGVRGATIAGGGAANLNFLFSANAVAGDFGTVGGGFLNQAAAGATVAGGCYNAANSPWVAIGGGTNNGGYGNGATVAGGGWNTVGANANYSAIAGGYGNTVSYGSYSMLGGGFQNLLGGDDNVLVGGVFNTNQGAFSVMVGGELNYNSARFAFQGGGVANQNSGWWSAIGGGDHNTNTAPYGFIGAGQANNNQGYGSLIAGGSRNSSSGIYSAVGGGELNASGALDATVGGGQGNLAAGSYAFVGGGKYNSATNSGATVPGGYANTAGGINSFAAGSGANALHAGAFVWADNQAGTFASSTSNQFAVRAGGGVTFQTSGAGLTVDGQPVLAGAVADSHLSTNVALLNANQTFAGINNLTNAANVISGNGANLTGIPRNYSTGGYIGTIAPTGSTNVFIGPTIPPLTLTAGQTVMLSTSAALGTSAASLQFNYSPSYTFNGGPVTFMAGGIYLTPVATAAGGRQIYSQSLTMTILTTGNYVFGCGVGNTSTSDLNYNDYVNVSLLIFK